MSNRGHKQAQPPALTPTEIKPTSLAGKEINMPVFRRRGAIIAVAGALFFLAAKKAPVLAELLESNDAREARLRKSSRERKIEAEALKLANIPGFKVLPNLANFYAETLCREANPALFADTAPQNPELFLAGFTKALNLDRQEVAKDNFFSLEAAERVMKHLLLKESLLVWAEPENRSLFLATLKNAGVSKMGERQSGRFLKIKGEFEFHCYHLDSLSTSTKPQLANPNFCKSLGGNKFFVTMLESSPLHDQDYYIFQATSWARAVWESLPEQKRTEISGKGQEQDFISSALYLKLFRDTMSNGAFLPILKRTYSVAQFKNMVKRKNESKLTTGLQIKADSPDVPDRVITALEDVFGEVSPTDSFNQYITASLNQLIPANPSMQTPRERPSSRLSTIGSINEVHQFDFEESSRAIAMQNRDTHFTSLLVKFMYTLEEQIADDFGLSKP